MTEAHLRTSISGETLAFSRRSAFALATFNRPRQRNALTRAMRSALAAAVPGWARDANLYAILLQSAVPAAFCAGGDVIEMVRLADDDPVAARAALAEEFRLIWLLECFSKPSVALIDGMVAGAGAGIAQVATHRVAGAAYSFAMPEVRIGFFPDDGVAHALARLPGEVGMYLGLTGRWIGRADAFALGLATHCIDAGDHETIRAGLADAEPVDPLLEALHRDPGPGQLAPWREAIAHCFSGQSLAEIRARLAAESGAARDWAQGVLADLDKASPLALAVTHRHIREAAARDLRQTLMLDDRLGGGLLFGADFREGVRALLIDKDGAPRWRPPRHADVSLGMVEALFAPRFGDELVLPTRQEMQAARV